MRKRRSFYGNYYTAPISNKPFPKDERTPNNKRMIAIVLAVVAILISAALATVAVSNNDSPQSTLRISAQTVLPGFALQYQHVDAGFNCTWCAIFMGWHFNTIVHWTDVKYGGSPLPPPGDNRYGLTGWLDDCPHCIVYSGPACIQMITDYRFGSGLSQDVIYESSELDNGAGEFAGNGWIDRHGFGMTDGTGVTPSEIQYAFQTYIGNYYQHNQWDATVLTAPVLESYILGMYPVLWDDRLNGWPINMDPRWPSADRFEQGHYKVIAGYNNSNTPSDYSDDLALIYDPWPEYNDPIAIPPPVLPPGALPGPTGLPDPYWLPIGLVLGDANDLFLVEFAAIPEFSDILIPIIGVTVMALAAIRIRRLRQDI